MPKHFAVADPDFFFRVFPKLSRQLRPTSPPNGDYICFSLAVGDTKRLWAPEKNGWWLPGVPRSDSVSSFVRLFKKLGYQKCNDGKFERGVRKVAIYAIGGSVKHVAAQPPDKRGKWHSKMGDNVNILHDLDDVAGPFYGEVVQFMRESKPSRARRVLSLACVSS